MILVWTSLVALVLLIWFRTDGWLEYTRLLHLNLLSFYKDFDSKFKEDVSLTYISYLRRYHDCFFVRLITCPICLGIWLGIGAAVLTNLFLFPVYVVGGLLLFTIIDRLLG